VEQIIGRVLRIGVLVSTTCLALGLAAAIVFGAGPTSQILLHAGIVILLATPVSRVLVSIVEYSLARDWTFALLTTIVFLELAASAVAALVFNRKL
jgi:uncharacterized membrane protein